MHQLIVTDTNGTEHRSDPSDLTADELVAAECILGAIGSRELYRLVVETPGGPVTVNARHVVTAQLVEVDA